MIPEFLRHSRWNVFYMICMAFGLLGAAQAQEAGEKLVRVTNVVQMTDAVMISNIAVNGKTVECGLFIKPPAVNQPVAPFQAGSDWLQHMTISLVNRTDKIIAFGAISLDFLDTGDCRTMPCATYGIHLGQMPTVDAYNGKTGKPLKPEHPERKPLDWKPGETMVVQVGDYIDEIADSLSNFLPVTAVTKVAIQMSACFFEDGMRWISPGYSVPDPDHHGKFKYLPLDYFPGKRGHNWPPGYNY